MSDYVTAPAQIISWFNDEWETGVPIHLVENTPFPDKPTDAVWARLRIRERDARVAAVGSVGTRIFRHDGDVVLEIFAPEGIGDGRARELANLGVTILQGREEGGVTVWAARAVPLGVRDGWYKINVLAPFQWDAAATVST